MKHKIAILSPHLDDAVFNCCDHMLEWRRDGCEMCVYTLFCSFQTSTIPLFQQDMMRKAGIESVDELEQTRRNEDIRAMQLLNVQWQHLNYIDGAFRSHNGASLYEDHRQLCSGKYHPNDEPLLVQLTELINTKVDADLLLVPLGVGQHQDHRIVRQAAEAARNPAKMRYYLDFPYARNPFRWHPRQFLEVMRSKKSIRLMSSEKRKIMGCYASQVTQVFRWPPIFPEVILG